jgi:hypothetical protein
MEATEAIGGRLDKLDCRMQRVETALNRLLELFGQPKVENEELQEHGSGRTNTSDSWTVVDTQTTIQAEGVLNISEPESPSTKTSNDDGPFSYKALDMSKSEIRILALHPSVDPSAPVVAELSTQSLDEKAYIPGSTFKQYAALSYTWGAPVFDTYITLNGSPLAVTASLESALRAMRSRNEATTLAATSAWPHDGSAPTHWWIDQICINQADVDERNEQVALMRRIYKRAGCVQVWLGDGTEESDAAMDLIQAIGAAPVRAPGEKEQPYPKFEEVDIERHWISLQALLSRPWWERVWIRQEVALSNTVTFVCGTKSVNLGTIGPVLAAIRYAESLGYMLPSSADSEGGENDDQITLPYTYHANSILSLHAATNGGYSWVPLQDLLPISRFCKATDPRDTVFSTLGLCDLELYPIYADYRSELSTVLATATRVIITGEYGLDILGTCQNVGRGGGLPSWVSDLSKPWKAMPFDTSCEGGGHSSELSVTSTDVANVQIEGECLILRGGHIDSIAHICTDSIVPNAASVEELDAVFAAWQKFVADMEEHLDEWTKYELLDEEKSEQLKYMHWVRFLSVLSDEARDLEPGSNEESRRNRYKGPKQRAGDARGATKHEILATAEAEFQHRNTHYHLNLKLCRAYLLPPNYDMGLHSHRRVHAGLKRNGPGRRLAITERGFVALIPAESEIGDSMAIIQGATFPYILRQYGGKKRHVLVGEAFAPIYTCGRGESLAKEEFNRSIDGIIRLY